MITCSIQKRMQKNRGGRPGLFYHVNDVFVYLGRQREGSPIERTHFGHTFFVLNQERYVFTLQTFETPALWTEIARSGLKLVFWTPPLLCLPTKCHSHDKMDQAFCLRFCILQAIKNWTIIPNKKFHSRTTFPAPMICFRPWSSHTGKRG